MITIGICDDEQKQREMLRKIVELEMELQGETCTILEYAAGEVLVSELKNRPDCLDILFLDIELGGITGMDAARILRDKKGKFELIFVTGYADYVFHGYEVQALNYILKPYQPEKIKAVLKTAIEKLNKSRDHYFPVQQKNQIRKVPLREVLYFTSDLRKIILVTKTERLEFYDRLPEVAKQLPPAFVRTHQRYIVHLKYVDQMDAKGMLINEELIPVSRKYYQEVSGAFARYLLAQ